MISGKVWGQTQLVLRTPFIEVHKLFIKPHAFCSWHHHEFKWNAFVTVSGVLQIEVKKNDYNLTDITFLHPTDLMTVKPGEKHRFVTGDKACVAFEFYYPEELSADIIRESVGGIGDKGK